MIRRWAHLLVTFGLAVAMLGAPCRNCAPKEEPKAPCGHDCCPKPKPERESKPCSWQPAGFDALETAKQAVTPDWQFTAVLDSPAPRLSANSTFLTASAALDRPPPAPPAALLPLRI